MSGREAFSFDAAAAASRPERALHFGVGAALAAPLWTGFCVAATAGAAWWWTTAWRSRDARAFAPALRLVPPPAGQPETPPLSIVELEAESPAAARAEPAPKAPEPEPAPAAPTQIRLVSSKADEVDTVALAEVVEARPAEAPETAAEAVHAAVEAVARKVKTTPRRKPKR